MADARQVIRLAAVGDLHVNAGSRGTLEPFFSRLSEVADVLILCGDLTDYGRPEEARVLARELSGVRVPMLGVLGNHDHESDKDEEIRRILIDVGVSILDGTAREIRGVGFAGVKGFAGGFGRRALAPWGERSLKQFVHEGMNEALKLESAMTKLWMPVKVAIMHYAPIQATVVGEPAEIMPFLGSSRLEDVVDRHRANVVFHGHAHRGTLEGRTRSGIPVYNVALPLLRAHHPDRPPYRVLELPVHAAPHAPAPGTAHPEGPSPSTPVAPPPEPPRADAVPPVSGGHAPAPPEPPAWPHG
ncbi:MAG: metallophosphoesterase [Myxococcota bacterium]